MIQLQLQRQGKPIGQICDGGEWQQDAEELALYWLAEVYAGTLDPTIPKPGPYHVEANGTDANGDSVHFVIHRDSPRMDEYLRDELWRQRERAEQFKWESKRA